MKHWDQDFDFYMARIDDKPASFVFDLNASQHAPLATHPLVVRVNIPMLKPRTDGLRSNEELEALGVLEDQFVSALETKVDAIYVGRTVYDGATELYLYVGEAHRSALESLPTLTGAPPAGYAPEWSVDEDPEWGNWDFLQPDPYAMQTIWNRRLMRNFVNEGDRLEARREVDHHAYFPSKEAAQAAQRALAAAHFRCDEIQANEEAEEGDEDAFAIEFHREDTLADERPDQFVFEILDIILPLDGNYDGWAATVERD